MDTDLPDIYRAILEGLTFEMAYNLEKLGEFGIAPKRMVATGGLVHLYGCKLKQIFWDRK